MGDIGGQLRQARQEAGLSLDQISARTKIKKSLLDAIEREDFEQLPRGFFRRGFLRAYAREVRLDAEAIVQEYVAEFEPNTSSSSALAFPTDRVDSEQTAGHRRRWQLLVTALLLGVPALWMYLKDSVDLSGVPGGPPPAIDGRGNGSPSDLPQEPPPGSTQDPASWQKPEELTLEIVPAGIVWVEATADGKRILYELIERGDRRTLHARDELVVRVGDTGAFQYWLNGERGRALGGPTEVRDIRITRDNYTTFQEP